MSDIMNSMWEPLDDANVHPSPDGVAKEDAPNTVPEVIRAMKGAVKRDVLLRNPTHTSSGAGNTYVLTYPKAPETYYPGQYWFVADKANTGPVTINVNGLGARSILNAAGAPLEAGQIVAGQAVCLAYLGTAFRMQFTHANPTFTGNVTATSFTGSGAALTALNATNLATGTVKNDRLPATMTGKTFSSATTVSTGGITVSAGGATITGATTVDGQRVLTLADIGAGKGLDSDLLDGQHGGWYQVRANHTGTQAISTVEGLQAALDNLVSIIDDPWYLQPLGALIPANMGITGFAPPATNKQYRYILLSAGAAAYNGTTLINETVTGTAPNISATARINLPGSVFHNQIVRLINTERRFPRPGDPGVLQDGQIQSHQHFGHTNPDGHHDHELPGELWSNNAGTSGSNHVQPSGSGYYNNNIGGRRTIGAGSHIHSFWTDMAGGDETRPRNIGVNYYMRIR